MDCSHTRVQSFVVVVVAVDVVVFVVVVAVNLFLLASQLNITFCNLMTWRFLFKLMLPSVNPTPARRGPVISLHTEKLTNSKTFCKTITIPTCSHTAFSLFLTNRTPETVHCKLAKTPLHLKLSSYSAHLFFWLLLSAPPELVPWLCTLNCVPYSFPLILSCVQLLAPY